MIQALTGWYMILGFIFPNAFLSLFKTETTFQLLFFIFSECYLKNNM